MPTTFTDLSYLSTFCKGDRTRMERYIRQYLDSSPAAFAQLLEKLMAGDAEGLAFVAHSLRPQATFMGAQAILDHLNSIERWARAEGAAACVGLVKSLDPLREQVDNELRAFLSA
jgi:HPt (histidine-containing phosphotransfer) domain-containing protein